MSGCPPTVYVLRVRTDMDGGIFASRAAAKRAFKAVVPGRWRENRYELDDGTLREWDWVSGDGEDAFWGTEASIAEIPVQGARG
jgi:hypothetical protein